MKGLYALKGWFTGILSPLLRLAVRWNISPNWLTSLGVAGAILAAWSFGAQLPWLVLFGLVMRLGGANLDGAVARARGIANSKSGFWINELGDRLSDFIVLAAPIIMAVAFSTRFLALLALLAATLPTLVSVRGYLRKAVRLNGGPLGKTERCLLVFLSSLAMQLGVSSETAISTLSWLIILGSIYTAIVRTRQLRKLGAHA